MADESHITLKSLNLLTDLFQESILPRPVCKFDFGVILTSALLGLHTCISYLATIFGRLASDLPWFLRSTAVLMQLSHQCWRWCRLW